MKTRVGEIYGKLVVVTMNPEEISMNEILYQETPDGKVSLKTRDFSGVIVEMTNVKSEQLPIVETAKVNIQTNSTISGSDKWVKGNNYLFYIGRNDSFIIKDTKSDKDLTDCANMIAVGKVNKVYEIPKEFHTDIAILED